MGAARIGVEKPCENDELGGANRVGELGRTGLSLEYWRDDVGHGDVGTRRTESFVKLRRPLELSGELDEYMRAVDEMGAGRP